ncbi:MAG: hypothetical protein A3C15_01775 [Candidatus Magasanikbacteria bacterium RIFCSPHIGHO2_02_FULL_50_9b]|nr:MAG: hypothetical protein A3C15_01775 [Candidatus Magasanikbacteria bacterium RIFCSPHIGHO2_02_FULL_50_9b]
MWKALLDAEETKNARGVDHVLLDYMRTEVSIDGIEPDSDQRVQRYTLFQVLLNAGHIRRYGVGERNETALAVVRRNADSNTGS